MANSNAITTDNFLKQEVGFAMGVNQIAAISGMSLSIVVGAIPSVKN